MKVDFFNNFFIVFGYLLEEAIVEILNFSNQFFLGEFGPCFPPKRSSFVWVEINILFVTTKSPNFSTKRNTTTYTQGEQENQTHSRR
jgi:hypothetical protein